MFSLHQEFFFYVRAVKTLTALAQAHLNLHRMLMCYTKQKLGYWLISFFAVAAFVCGMHGSKRGTGGSDPPPIKTQKYRIILVRDPVENHKAAWSAFNVGPSTVCRRAYGCRLIVVFGSSLLFINLKKTLLKLNK